MKLVLHIRFRYNDYRIKDRRASNDRKRQAGRTADEARVGEAGVLRWKNEVLVLVLDQKKLESSKEFLEP